MMNIKDKSWYIDIDKVKTDYIVIENLAQFKSPKVPYLHPEHPKYKRFWAREIKRCIEGVWGNEFGKHRFMPPKLYFFGNYGLIEDTDHETKMTSYFKPKIVDFIWDYAYMSIVAYGFSGFSKDDKISCHETLKQYKEGSIELKYVHKSCFDKDGNLKVYENPYSYVSRLHDTILGKPQYFNQTSNTVLIGSRGGGKSYWAGIAEIEHNFVFRGARRYEDFKKAKSDQCVGSGDTEKSSELLDKFFESQMAKANAEVKDYVDWFGIYVENRGGKTITHPCPLYVRSSGSLAPSNKKNKYRNKYKKKIDGSYQLIGGTGSSIAHVNFSPQKGGKGDTAAAGGRYVYVNVEEVGLLPNYISVMGSNEGTISRGGVRFGVQACQGTSGSLEDVQAVKSVFLDPRSYHMIPFPNKWTNEGTNGEIGYFLPNYITLFKYKDENGNTDFKSAIDDVNRVRAEKAKSKDPRVLRDFLMNKPCLTHEMWFSEKGYHLPSQEASERNRELMNGNMYKELGVPVEFFWKPDGSPGYTIVTDREPHYHFPVPKDKSDPSGCVVIYEQPEPDPYGDMYAFVGYDPYIAEDLDKGGSYGVTYILKNPKYIPFGHSGNIIVASYIGKPIKGLDYYHSQQEKLIAYYGDNSRSLWYESNRGEQCRAWYISRNKFNLLAPSPQLFQGNSIYEQKETKTGFYVGANGSLGKKNLLKTLRDWLLEETEIQGETKNNIYRIPCKFLINQIEAFELEGNYDAVSAMIGCVLGLKEYDLRFTEEATSSNDRLKSFFGNSLNYLVN